jgi:plasmid stability protein
MADVLIRNVPQPLLEALKERSAQHRRSLQQELLSILESAIAGSAEGSPAQVAAVIRNRLAESGRTFSDSAALIREDRER